MPLSLPIKVEAFTSKWKKKDHLLIIVQDNAIEIPEKLQPFIFDEFTNQRERD